MRLLAVVLGVGLSLSGASVANAQGPYGDPYGDPYVSPGGGMTGNVVLFVGAKAMDEAEWAPAHEHGEVGLGMDLQPMGWPVGVDVRLLSSGSDLVYEPTLGAWVELNTTELDFGVRKTWGEGGLTNVRPYVAGGIAMIDAELFIDGNGASGSGTGIWLAGGVYWILSGASGPGVTLGLELMSSAADADFPFGTFSAGGGHFNFTVGYHF
ncbi:MAG: outer membrane beta-barrel protein [Nitrospirota bacterium]|nr:outer membrane beta-barrel protein [Nitrospirota bacterium]